MTQEQVSVLFGVTECCVTNWELHHSKPEIRYYPKIISFIGYCPYSPSSDLTDRLKAVREALGLTQRDLQKLLQIDQSTITGWERKVHRPGKKLSERIQRFLLSPDSENS